MKVSRPLHRKGFTLIELVVAMAIFVVVIAGISAALGAFFRLKSTYDQQMIVQQNFGVAVSRISQDMRAAVEYTDPGPPQVKRIVQDPAGKSMGETLTIYVSSTQKVTYKVQSNPSGGFAVTRNDEPITENMRQLVRLYFASDGAKVVVMMVGETTYGGHANWMSYTSLIYARNTGYPPS